VLSLSAIWQSRDGFLVSCFYTVIISDVCKIRRTDEKFHKDTETFVITFNVPSETTKRFQHGNSVVPELHFAIHTASLSLSDLNII
jgi:hypothetical protein